MKTVGTFKPDGGELEAELDAMPKLGDKEKKVLAPQIMKTVAERWVRKHKEQHKGKASSASSYLRSDVPLEHKSTKKLVEKKPPTAAEDAADRRGEGGRVGKEEQSVQRINTQCLCVVSIRKPIQSADYNSNHEASCDSEARLHGSEPTDISRPRQGYCLRRKPRIQRAQ